MIAILSLGLALWLGMKVTDSLFHETNRFHGNSLWVRLSSGFGAGILLLTWVVYGLAWLFHVFGGSRHPLGPANAVALPLCAAALLFSFFRARRQGRKKDRRLVQNRGLFVRELVLYGTLLLFLIFTMTYVFYQKDGILYSGYTVFGDYAPHTAMIRSFSRLANFPTQYPHFGGEDVKYHFMFQFLVGNLEYLGLPLDVAYNVPSVLSLLAFLVMLTQLVLRLSRSFGAAALSAPFFFFRSGTAFWRYLWEHLLAGDLGRTLAENTAFIGYTAKENWGLWNYNVYLNQRHLGFGLLISAMVLWFFLDTVEEIKGSESPRAFLKDRIFSLSAWEWKDPLGALFWGILLGMCAFFNGAAVIGGLLILFGMAVFANAKLDYVVTAAAAVLLSSVQTHLFIRGSAVSPGIYWGFLAENRSPLGVLWYLIQITGPVIVGLWILQFLLARTHRILIFAFSCPVLFAFVGSLTPDITVNHKYIMIGLAYLNIFWGILAARMFRRGWLQKGAAVALVLALTITGLYDFVVILKDNDSHHRVQVNLDSRLTAWLDETMTEEDLILSPEYSINEVTMAGVMLYEGWPYYAWSAGYNTYYRAEIASTIYTTEEKALLETLVAQEGIDYIIFEEGMTFEENECREDVIADAYPLVYQSEDGRIRIYDTEQ